MKRTMVGAVVSLLAAGVLMGGCMADGGGESDSEGVAAEGPNVSGGEEVGEAKQALIAGTWSSWQALGGTTLHGPSIASRGVDKLDAFVLGTDNNIYINRYENLAWGGWTSLGAPAGKTFVSSPDAVSPDANSVSVAARANDNKFYLNTWTATGWSGWSVLPGTFSNHGPGMSSRGPGSLDVFGSGTDSKTWNPWLGGGAWRCCVALGSPQNASLASDVSSVSWDSSKVDVFVRGPNNRLWTRWWDISNGWNSQGWRELGGEFLSGFGVASWAPRHLDVFGVGTDANIWQIQYDAGWTGFSFVGAPPGLTVASDPDAVSSGVGRIDLIVRGSDNQPWVRSFTSNGVPPAAEAITINTTAVVRSTATRPVGINLNYLVDDEASRPAGSPRTLSQALGDMKGRFLRFPGGEKSDNYVWTTVSSTNSALVTTSTTIPSPLTPRVANPSRWPGNGSYANATTGIFNGPNVDFDEFMTLCQANGAEPVIVVAYDQAREITGLPTGPTLAELISSAAAWVKYANVTKGYNVRYWSIGNESWFRTGQTASIYAAHVNQFAAAMRQVDPTIKIGAHGNSTAWFNTVIANSSSAIDWLDVHDYPTYDWATGYDVFRLSDQTLTADVNKAITSIAAAPSPADRARLTVGVTETNTIDWANGPDYTWPHVNDLGHALVTFDMIGQQLSKPKVEFTQLWNTRWINNVSYTPGTVPNAVVNPDFESNLNNWSGSGGVITTSPVHSGTKALQGNSGASVYQDISLGAGNVLTFTAYARTSDASIWSGVGVDFLNSSGTKIDGITEQITSTSYRKYSRSFFTTPAGTTTVRVWLSVGSGATAFLDKIVLTDRREPEVYDALAPDNSYLPAGRVMALWGQFLRDNLVQGSRSDSVIAYASRSTSDNTLSVWLLNKQTAPVNVNLTLNNYTPAASASAWRFAGSGPSDFAPTYTSLPAVPVPGNVMPITLPQTSITVLVFSPL